MENSNIFFLLLILSVLTTVLSLPLPHQQNRNASQNSSRSTVRVTGGYMARRPTMDRLAFVRVIVLNHETNRRIKRACSGSVIATDLVLTAAHCVRLKDCEEIVGVSVSIGLQQRANLELRQFKRKVQFIYRYKYYKPANAHYGDLAIFVIRDDDMLSYDHPIFDMPDQDEVVADDGDTVYAAGYGLNGRPGVGLKPSALQEVKLVKWNFQRCKAFKPHRLSDENSDICAGGADWDNDQKGTCAGDSGGPLFVKEKDGNYKQIGVTSGGLTRCDEPGSKGRYTRLAGFRDHIQELENDDTSAWEEIYKGDDFED